MKIQFWLLKHVGFIFPLSTLNDKNIKYCNIITKSSWVNGFHKMQEERKLTVLHRTFILKCITEIFAFMFH